MITMPSYLTKASLSIYREEYKRQSFTARLQLPTQNRSSFLMSMRMKLFSFCCCFCCESTWCQISTKMLTRFKSRTCLRYDEPSAMTFESANRHCFMTRGEFRCELNWRCIILIRLYWELRSTKALTLLSECISQLKFPTRCHVSESRGVFC